MSDPSDFVRNPPSVIVKVQNTSQESMNGQLGVVVQYNQDRGRYLVHMAETQQTVALKPENLVKGNILDQMKAQYTLLTKDPRVGQEIQKYYSLFKSKLPAGVAPEHVGFLLVILLVTSMYFLGFTRVVMSLSIILMLGLIVAPDVFTTNGQSINWRLVASNFPGRCRHVIEQTVPMARNKLSDRAAAGLVLAFLVFSARAIVSSPAAAAAAARRPSSPLPPQTSKSMAISIQDAYKLGFDDANTGKLFGTSLPEETISSSSSSSLLYEDDLQPIDYRSYDLPPPMTKPWYSKLGIWQVMSALNIGRTLYEVGRDPVAGSFSPQRAFANLQTAEPMKLGLLGLSVYNVLKVFFERSG